jgi:hypothetical protein
MTTAAEVVAFIANLNVAQLDALANAIGQRKQQLTDSAFMAGVIRDQRQSPVGFQPAQRVRVEGAPEVKTAGSGTGWYDPPNVDSWKPPQQDLIDRAFPAHGPGGFNA